MGGRAPRVAWIGLAALLAASAGLAAAAAAQQKAGKPVVDRDWVIQRASEAGAWWMLVQATCDTVAASKLLDEMNGAMVAIGASELQHLVAERIEDPHLDERSRGEMERLMQQAAAARRQAYEMLETKAAIGARKAAPGALQRSHWQVARPIRSAADLDAALQDTERALARFCAQGAANAKAALLDPHTGLVARLR